MKNTIGIWFNFMLIAGFVLTLVTNCKKNEDTNDPNQTQNSTVNDIEGNAYHTVTIGTQVWMVENLKTTKYRNGEVIPKVTDNTNWNKLKTGAYCDFANDVAMGKKYGKLYNWYAVNDSRNIAPTGWHIPTDEEFTTLENYVEYNRGTSPNYAQALAAKTDWIMNASDLLNNNSSGFTALPGGDRYFNGTFGTFGSYGCWWSSTENSSSGGYSRYLFLDIKTFARYIFSNKEEGLSVRCIKD